MNWALQLSVMHTDKDLKSAFVLDSKINKEYILDKTTEKLHHRKKKDLQALFGLPSLSVEIFMW